MAEACMSNVIEPQLQKLLESHPNVGNVRVLERNCSILLVQGKETVNGLTTWLKFDPRLKISGIFANYAREQKLLVHPGEGDHISFELAHDCSHEQIKQMVDKIVQVLSVFSERFGTSEDLGDPSAVLIGHVPDKHIRKEPELTAKALEVDFRLINHRWQRRAAGLVDTEYAEYAILIENIFDFYGRPQSTIFIIQAECLQQALNKEFDVKELLITSGRPHLQAEVLYKYLSNLEAYRRKLSPDDVVLQHLELLIEKVRNHFAQTTSQLTTLLSKKVISFDHLWVLFKSGDRVFAKTKVLGNLRCYKVHAIDLIRDRNQQPEKYTVKASFIDYDGQSYVDRTVNLEFQSFQGLREICTLTAYPLKYAERATEVDESIIARGEYFRHLGEDLHKVVEYSGYALDQNDARVFIRGRIVIDPELYFNTIKKSSLEAKGKENGKDKDEGENTGYERSEPRPSGPTCHADLLICSPLIGGYSVEENQWFQFALSDIQPVTWRVKTLDQLVLGASKDTLRDQISGHFLQKTGTSLVTTNESDPTVTNMPDPIRSGLAYLLCGPSGVGKTLTVAMLAEYHQKPLLLIPVESLDPEATKLKAHFQSATRWGAILLFDEADSMIKQRDPKVYGPLLMAFLRHVETYKGLLFLTTNLDIRNVDRAVLSRMHEVLQFTMPDMKEKRTIWQNVLKDVGAEEFQEEVINNWCSGSLSGRDIKHIVQVAKKIADGKGKKLTSQLLQDVLNRRLKMLDGPHCSLYG